MSDTLQKQITAMDTGIFSTDFSTLLERKKLTESLAAQADDSGALPTFDSDKVLRALRWTYAKLKWHLGGLQTLRFLRKDSEGQSYLDVDSMAFRDRQARGVRHS